MKFRLTSLFLFLYLYGNSIPVNLKRSNIVVMNGTVYFFGLAESAKTCSFRCFSYNVELAPLDSFAFDLGAAKADNFHEIGVDTTHGFLNFWFQQKNDDKHAVYLRLNNRLKQVFVNGTAELTRINTQFVYDDDKICCRNRIYVIRSPRDSAHKFFLSCYELKDDRSFFDYEIKWGFRFYKFNYLRCKLLMADDEKVLVYVHALDGDKKGQYILSVNAQNGELLRTAKFNDEKDAVQYSYFFSSLEYNSERKEYFSAGLITKAGEEASLLIPKKAPQLFLIVLNERAEVKYRFNDLAVLPAAALKAKDLKNICVRVKDIHVTGTGQVEVISEVAGSADGKRFRPYGYWLVSFTFTDGVKKILVNEYHNLIDNPANKLVTRQAADINGVFSIRSAAENDKAIFVEHLQEVLLAEKAEGAGLKLIARRKELGTKKIIYSEIKFTQGGKMEQKHLYDATFDETPVCLPLDRYNAIIFSKSKTEGLILKKVAW